MSEWATVSALVLVVALVFDYLPTGLMIVVVFTTLAVAHSFTTNKVSDKALSEGGE